MTVRKNSWIRRVIAAGMAMGIVVSTTLPSLAEGVAGDGYGSPDNGGGWLGRH